MMAEKLLLINSVRHVPGSVSAQGDVVLKFEAETKEGPMLLHFTSAAASQLKAFLDTPVKSMRRGGTLAPESD
jgi:hypothetical protein